MTTSLSADLHAPLGGRPPMAVQPAWRTSYVTFLVFALPLFFSVFRYIPLLKWSLELGIVVAIGMAIFSNLSLGNQRRLEPKRSLFNIYILLTAFALPALGALAAYIVFDQPFIYGLAAQRGCLLALFAYGLSNLIASGRIKISELERALIILAWINLALCTPVLIFLDPNNYSDLGSLVSDGGGVFNEFHLPMPFIIFGLMYYVSVWMLSGRSYYGLFAIPFVIFIVSGNNGRILNIAIVSGLMSVAWIGSPHTRVKNIVSAVLFALVAMLAVSFLNPDKIGTMIEKYNDAFAAVTGAQSVNDISANARIIQTDIVWPYIDDSPIIGTGVLSNEWNGGYQQMFGYFHPSDLGIIGLIFTYGFVGVLFFWFQYVLIIRITPLVSFMSRRVPNNAFLIAIFANLLVMIIASIASGVFILVPEQSLFFFVIIIAQAKYNNVVAVSR